MFDTKLTPNVGRFRPMRVGITDFHTIEEDEKKATVYQLFIEPHRREGGPVNYVYSGEALLRICESEQHLASCSRVPLTVFHSWESYCLRRSQSPGQPGLD